MEIKIKSIHFDTTEKLEAFIERKSPSWKSLLRIYRK